MAGPESVTKQRGQKVLGHEIILWVNERGIDEFRQKHDRVTFVMKM